MNILVTGGSTGLGAAIVAQLSAISGNVVYFTYARSLDAARELQNKQAGCVPVFCDFTQADSVAALVTAIAGMDLDVLVNNACAGMHKEHFYKADPAIFADSFHRNVLPVLNITRAAMNVFRKKKAGRIINILSSAIVNKPPVGWSEYAANKAYLLSMSKSWATEGIRFNITSNSISPSFMATAFTSDTDERIVEQMIDAHPLKKLLTTEEVSAAVVFYTQAPRHINGTHLVINAGMDII